MNNLSFNLAPPVLMKLGMVVVDGLNNFLFNTRSVRYEAAIIFASEVSMRSRFQFKSFENK